MQHGKQLRLGNLYALIFTLFFAAVLVAQSQTAAPSGNSSPDRLPQRMEQLLPHSGLANSGLANSGLAKSGQTFPAGAEAPPPARLDPTFA